jgi:hypothetical protein
MLRLPGIKVVLVLGTLRALHIDPRCVPALTAAVGKDLAFGKPHTEKSSSITWSRNVNDQLDLANGPGNGPLSTTLER